ncbi:hypothetical protein D3C87_1596660 [compost metagenome]
MASPTATSRSASSNTMKGAFPPSSIDIFFIEVAQAAVSIFPTAVEPVKVSFLTNGWRVRTEPIPAGAPVTTLMTPFGIPASWDRNASASAESGVTSDGFRTTVQPAASAGASFRVTMADGKFHGVIAATTPTGSLRTNSRVSGEWLGIVSPYKRFASSANHSMKEAA